MRDKLLVNFLTTQAWALHEPTLRSLAGVIARHASGLKLNSVQVQQVVMEAAANRPARVEVGAHGYCLADGIAILPIQGVIAKRSSEVNGISQPEGTSCEAIAETLQACLDDPGVNAILLDVHSPGGAVEGICDLSDMIFAAGESKTIVAQCNELMASAAYWLGCQSAAIYLPPTAVIGSIGVYTVAADYSRLFQEDFKTAIHVIKSGEHKGDFEPGTEITEEQIEEAQRLVDRSADVFIDHVARGLSISTEAAAELADGRVHVGRDAVVAGLADGVQSFDQTLAEMIDEYGSGARAAVVGRIGARSKSTSRSQSPRRPRLAAGPFQE